MLSPTGCNPRRPPLVNFSADGAGVSRATKSRIPSNNARTEACRAFSQLVIPLLPEAGLCPMAVPHLAGLD